jgi:hypothetical protein
MINSLKLFLYHKVLKISYWSTMEWTGPLIVESETESEICGKLETLLMFRIL